MARLLISALVLGFSAPLFANDSATAELARQAAIATRNSAQAAHSDMESSFAGAVQALDDAYDLMMDETHWSCYPYEDWRDMMNTLDAHGRTIEDKADEYGAEEDRVFGPDTYTNGLQNYDNGMNLLPGAFFSTAIQYFDFATADFQLTLNCANSYFWQAEALGQQSANLHNQVIAEIEAWCGSGAGY